MTLRDVADHPDESWMVLIKGEPKTGKSIGACSFPGHTFVFDMDGRMRSVATFLGKWNPAKLDDICFRTYRAGDYLEFEKMFNDIQSGVCPGCVGQKCNKRLRTVSLDGVTSSGTMILDYLLENRGHANEKKRGVIKLLEIEDFGGEAMAFEQIVECARAVREKGANFILTAHVIITESTNLKTQLTQTSRALLTGGKKIASKLPVWFDEVWHFGTETIATEKGLRSKYFAYFNHGGVDFAGTSMDLPQRIEWTDQNLYQLVMKEVEKGQQLYKGGGIQRLVQGGER